MPTLAKKVRGRKLPLFPLARFRRNTSKFILRKFEKGIDILFIIWYNMYVIKRDYKTKYGTMPHKRKETTMNITKNRNLINFTNNEGKTYVFNLTTGELLGLRGLPIKTFPRKGDMVRALRRANNNLYTALGIMIDRATSPSYVMRGSAEAILQGAERLDALDIPNLDLRYVDYYAEINEHFNDFLTYIRQNEGADNYHHGDFQNWLTFRKSSAKLGALANVITPALYRDYINCSNKREDDISLAEWDIVAYYGIRCKVYQFCGGARKIAHYIHWCEEMNIEPQKINNFTRVYVETEMEYKRRKEEIDNAKFCANYAKHKKAWDFTFGDYTIVVPSRGQDLIDEGQNMHHCVGSYVNSVVNGSTNIVFVRHKDTPNKCYITAQVGTDGYIGQYYLAYDHRITEAKDHEFYRAFQEHLHKVWNEG